MYVHLNDMTCMVTEIYLSYVDIDILLSKNNLNHGSLITLPICVWVAPFRCKCMGLAHTCIGQNTSIG